MSRLAPAVTDAVLHIPHASPSIRLAGFTHGELFSRPEEEITADVHRSTDWFTDDLFAGLDAVRVAAPYSRLLVDVERFVDDTQEVMAGAGRGVIYTHGTDGRRIRRKPRGRLRARLLALYREHHNALEQAVAAALNRHGRCLIIDCHSFPDTPWHVEQIRTEPRPDICLGSDPFHTPRRLRKVADRAFSAAGYDPVWNDPYSGSIVPAAHYRSDRRVHSVMIEINRRLYMNEQTGRKIAPRYRVIREQLTRILTRIVRDWRGEKAE